MAANRPQPAGDAAKTALTHVENTLDPIIFPDSRVLLLGSMPSPKSREIGFYFGNPQNRFWRVVAALYGRNPSSPYLKRLTSVKDIILLFVMCLRLVTLRVQVTLLLQIQFHTTLALLFKIHQSALFLHLVGRQQNFISATPSNKLVFLHVNCPLQVLLMPVCQLMI